MAAELIIAPEAARDIEGQERAGTVY